MLTGGVVNQKKAGFDAVVKASLHCWLPQQAGMVALPVPLLARTFILNFFPPSRPIRWWTGRSDTVRVAPSSWDCCSCRFVATPGQGGAADGFLTPSGDVTEQTWEIGAFFLILRNKMGSFPPSHLLLMGLKSPVRIPLHPGIAPGMFHPIPSPDGKRLRIRSCQRRFKGDFVSLWVSRCPRKRPSACS